MAELVVGLVCPMEDCVRKDERDCLRLQTAPLVRRIRLSSKCRIRPELRFEDRFEPAVDPIAVVRLDRYVPVGRGRETGRHDGILPIHDQNIVRVVKVVFGDMSVRGYEFSFGSHRFDASHREARLPGMLNVDDCPRFAVEIEQAGFRQRGEAEIPDRRAAQTLVLQLHFPVQNPALEKHVGEAASAGPLDLSGHAVQQPVPVAVNGADEHQIVAVVGLLPADFLVVSQVEQRQEADAELLAVGLVERKGPVEHGQDAQRVAVVGNRVPMVNDQLRLGMQFLDFIEILNGNGLALDEKDIIVLPVLGALDDPDMVTVDVAGQQIPVDPDRGLDRERVGRALVEIVHAGSHALHLRADFVLIAERLRGEEQNASVF